MRIFPNIHLRFLAQESPGPATSFRVPDDCNKASITFNNGQKGGITCNFDPKTNRLTNVRLNVEAPSGQTLKTCTVTTVFPKLINTGTNPQTGQKVFSTIESEVFQIGGKSKYSINDFGESDGTSNGIVQPSAVSFTCDINAPTQAAPLSLLPNVYSNKQEKKPKTVKVSGSFNIPSQCGSEKKDQKVKVKLNCPNNEESNQEKKGLGANLEIQTINSNENIHSCNLTTNYAQKAYFGTGADGVYLSGTEHKTGDIAIGRSSYTTYSLNKISLNSVIAQNAGYTGSTSEMPATRVRYSCEIQTQPSANTVPNWQQSQAPHGDPLTTAGIGLALVASRFGK